MKRVIFVLFTILFSFIWGSGSLYGKVPRRESDALRTFFDTVDGKNWNKRDNWEGQPGTENTWHGVKCDTGNTTVLEIELRDNNLTGILPAEISDLKNLKSLVLSDNALTGLHPDLGKLSNLTRLDLSNNRLSGPIPRWIGNLKNLTTLDLGNNRLTGPLPQWIGNLTNLEVLVLDGNRLSGPIPGVLGNLSKLTVLRIGHNQLKGKIPATLAKLTRLKNDRSNFKWNGLYTDNDSLGAFLNKKQSGQNWESTQTIAPGGLTAFSPSNTSITLKWAPIAYTADNGGCQVFYSTTPGGPYNHYGTAKDKTTSRMEIKELKQSTPYYFVVRVWTARHASNRNKIESEFSREISITTRGTTISGYVKTPGGKVVPGVKLGISDKGGETFTDAKGNYNLCVTPGWSGTVTPYKKGFDLYPARKRYTAVNENRDGEDYTAKINTIISGRITDSKGKGIPGITLTFSHKEGTAATDLKGNYRHTVTYNWAGTVKPSKTGYKFDPLHRKYTGVTAAAPDQDYKAFYPPIIRGRVKNRRGKAVPDVTMTFSSREKAPATSLDTDENGEYLKVVINKWTGRVTPAKKGFIFYPAKRNFQNITIDSVHKANYKAEPNFKFFISITGNYIIPSEPKFDDIYGKGLFSPGITAGYKFYRDFYMWAGYGFFSKRGTSVELEAEVKTRQSFISFGLGYHMNISITLDCRAEVGVSYINAREEARDFGNGGTGSSKTIGVKMRASGILKITDRLFTEISIGYLYASDTIDEIPGKIKLGGLKPGIGLGLKF